MSGGVDSSVTAALLLQQGFEVIGVTMKVIPNLEQQNQCGESACCSLDAVEDARAVANKLGIPHYVLNFQDLFKEKVIDYFIDEYLHGKTPNPCLACNKFIKFSALLDKAKALGASYIATGHYAKIEFDEKLERYVIRKSLAVAKDQTYVLYNFTQEQLKHTLMPLGYFTKEQVREIASKLELSVASKPESQEICFIPDNNYGKFIEENIDYKVSSGNFVDTKGNILGKHKGIIHYTIGQRKGLGIAFGKPMFVVGIDVKNNNVILGENDEVFSDKLIAHSVNFIAFEELRDSIRVNAKIRYSAKEAPAIVTPIGDSKIKVEFEHPQRAITPGQAVVFYDGDIVVGGAIIE